MPILIPDSRSIQQTDASNPQRPVKVGELPNLRAQRLPNSPPNLHYKLSASPEIMKRERENELAYTKIRMESSQETQKMLVGALNTMQKSLTIWADRAEKREIAKASAGFRANQIEIQTEFQKRTDFQNFDTDYMKAMEKAREEYGEIVTTAGGREFFEAESNLLTQHGRSKVVQRATSLENDFEISSTNELINDTFDKALASGDNELITDAISLAETEYDRLLDEGRIGFDAARKAKESAARTMFQNSLAMLDQDDEQQERLILLNHFKGSDVIPEAEWNKEHEDTLFRIEAIGVKAGIGGLMQQNTKDDGTVTWTPLYDHVKTFDDPRLQKIAFDEVNYQKGMSEFAANERRSDHYEKLAKAMVLGDDNGVKLKFSEIPRSDLEQLKAGEIKSLDSIDNGIGGTKLQEVNAKLALTGIVQKLKAKPAMYDTLRRQYMAIFQTSGHLVGDEQSYITTYSAFKEGANVPEVAEFEGYMGGFKDYVELNSIDDDQKPALKDAWKDSFENYKMIHDGNTPDQKWMDETLNQLYSAQVEKDVYLGVFDRDYRVYQDEEATDALTLDQIKTMDRDNFSTAMDLYYETNGRFPSGDEDKISEYHKFKERMWNAYQ